MNNNNSTSEAFSVNPLDNTWGDRPDYTGLPGGVITYSFVDAGWDDVLLSNSYNGLTQSFEQLFDFDYKQAARDALDAWSAIANIEFVGVEDKGGNIGNVTYPDMRISLGSLDGDSNVLAYGAYPNPDSGYAGDIRLDSDEENFWDYSTFYQVMLHEIGHAIGLAHSADKTAVMYGTYNDDIDALETDDVDGAKYLYGDQDNKESRYYLSEGSEDIAIMDGIENLYVYGNTDANKITASDDSIWVSAGEGNDTVLGGLGDDTLLGGDGNDRQYGGAGSDVIIGGDGLDSLVGGGGDDVLEGGLGNDTLGGRTGRDILYGGDGNDRLVGNGGRDFLDGGRDNDTLSGGGSRDTLVGNEGRDKLYGDGGRDLLQGDGGSDLLKGGAGRDSLFGGSGHDRLYGNDGADKFYAGSGDDYIHGGKGRDVAFFEGTEKDYSVSKKGGTTTVLHKQSGDVNTLKNIEVIRFADDVAPNEGSGSGDNISGTGNADSLVGGSNDDFIKGYEANDVLIGGGGQDSIDGGDHADRLFGQSGDDTLDGGNGNDKLYGGSGNDRLSGGEGSDILIGGEGNDTLSSEGAFAQNHIETGTGDDHIVLDNFGNNYTTVSYQKLGSSDIGSNNGLIVDLAKGTIDKGNAGQDTISNLHRIYDYSTAQHAGFSLIGTSGDDLIGGLTKSNVYAEYSGWRGNDTISGAGSRDWVNYDHADTENGVNIDLSTGVVADDGFGDQDQLTGIEGVIGSKFADNIVGSGATETLLGGLGNDTIAGGSGDDEINGGAGQDTVILEGYSQNYTFEIHGNTTIATNIQTGEITTLKDIETIEYSASGSSVVGTSGNDNLVGGAENDVIDGLAGNDILNGSAGADTLFGGEGADTLIGGAGDDYIDGGSDDDSLSYSGSTAGVNVSLKNGTATGEGSDTLVSIENLYGSGHDDVLEGTDQGNRIHSGDGDDLINAGAGNDTLYGEAGDDTINGGDGTDTIVYTNTSQGVSVDLNTGLSIGDGTDHLSSIEDVNATMFDDTIYGDDQDNKIYTWAGDDFVSGGAGNDMLISSIHGDTPSGNDTLIGGDGDDYLDGGDGADSLIGGAGDDRLILGSNRSIDYARPGTGGGNISVGDGYYFIDYQDLTQDDLGAGNGIVFNFQTGRIDKGDTGQDVLYTWNIPSYSSASYAGLQIRASVGDDLFIGLPEDDVYALYEGYRGNDTINGGSSRDWAGYHIDDVENGIVADLSTGIVSDDGYGDQDQLSGIEGIEGSKYGDQITGSSADETLRGNEGDDTLKGGAGNDTLEGGAGDDTAIFDGVASDYTIVVDGDITTVTHQETGDVDVLTEIENIEFVSASAAQTVEPADSPVVNNSGDDLLYGSSTDDLLEGGEGRDTLYGEEGDDTLDGGNGDDYLVGGDGDDLFILGGGSNIAYGGDGNDTAIIEGYADEYHVSDDGITKTIFHWKSGKEQELIQVENIQFSSVRIPVNGTTSNDDLSGDANEDLMYGLAGEDQINGFGGNDTLYGGDGDDTLTGGSGNDSLHGGSGLDWVDYDVDTVENGVYVDLSTSVVSDDGFGNWDILTGFEGVIGTVFDDFIFGSDGDETLIGGDGDDTLRGGPGSDILDGGAGNDTAAFEGFAEDYTVAVSGDTTTVTHISTGDVTTLTDVETLTFGVVYQTNGRNSAYGTSHDDLIIGTDNWSYLYGYEGDDQMYGNGGHNSFIGGEGDDSLYGGAGLNDNADYRRATNGVNVNLQTGIATGEGTDLLVDIESVEATIYDDTVQGNEKDNDLYLGDGDDITYGAGGNDYLYLGNGNDTAYGDDGNDTLHGYTGDDLLYGGSGDDLITTYTGNNTLVGGSGTDTLEGGSGLDWVGFDVENVENGIKIDLSVGFVADDGFGNQEELSGFEGVTGTIFNDVISGSDGDETLAGNDGDDTLNGGSGSDVLIGGAGNDTAVFDGDAADYSVAVDGDITTVTHTLTGDVTTLTEIETIEFKAISIAQIGTINADVITGNADNDLMYGRAGDDLLTGSDGRDTLYGEAGNDTLTGGADDDLLIGGGGNDVVDGGAGDDTVIMSGTSSDYTLSVNGASQTLTHTITGDVTSLANVEFIEYDTIYQSSGSSRAWGTFRDDVIIGTDNWSYLYGYEGNDQMYGNGGNNSFRGGEGDDSLYGGTGLSDIADYRGVTNGVNVNLLTGVATGEGTDHLEDIEFVYTTNFNDTVQGNDRYNNYALYDGDDLAYGAGGDDYLYMDEGNDTAYGDEGNDTLHGYTGDDLLYGGSGDDSITAYTGDDTLNGGSGNDILSASSGFDWVDYDNADVVNGIQVDLAVGVALDDGYGGQDQLSGIEAVIGSSLDDVISGSNASEILVGGEGADILSGKNGADTYLYSRGDGSDVIDDKSSDTASDSLLFEGNIDHDQLWFEQSGDDLLISIIGGDGSITVDDWYISENQKIETIQSGDGHSLDISGVETLVNAMAGFASPGAGDIDLSDSQYDALQSDITANWL